MESKGIITVAVTVTVAVIVLAGILMPVLTDATKTEKEFTNTGNGSYAYISSEDSYTMEWHYSTPAKVTVNGVEIDAVSGNDILAMGDFCIRINTNASNGYAQLIMANNESGVTANVGDEKDFTLSYSDGTLTASNGSTTKTIDLDGFYGLVPSGGKYVMKTSSASAYLNEDDQLLVMGVTAVGSQWNTGYMVSGTIKDYEVTQWTGTTSYEPTNITDDSALVSGCKDVYTIKQFQWTIDRSGTPQTVTYNYFLVPVEVTGELSQHLSSSQVSLLTVIPMLIIVAMLIGVAAVVLRNRMG